ncbi:MAG: threonine ammonia-lyase, biosynthetic [Pseudomonadota bacterium]|jgi:threonine dehydratase
MLTSYVKKILQARVYDVAKETDLDHAKNLSKRLGNEIYIKREDQQPVFSFKLRGAYNKMAHLSPEMAARGVIAASAGNHAQGVALAAKKLQIKALIVMPKTTPDIKINAVRELDAEIILHGNSYDDAGAHAKKLAEEQELTFIHPYDDAEVIAGQGTIGMEILHQHTGDIHAIFVPVGGGGLIAGIAAYVKYVRPDIKIIGVEPDDAACLYAALRANERVILPQVGIFADGVAVRQIGKEPFELAKNYVDDVILVNTDAICAAIKDIFEATRVVTEPAGALALAGLKEYVSQHNIKNQTLITISSGANMNFERLQHVAERTEVGEQREALMAVTIPEKSGSFRTFCHTLGQRTITEFNYRYADDHDAQVFVGVRLGEQGMKEKERLIQKLNDKDYRVVDLTDNEIAKIHVRHMVGGHSYKPLNEHLYRVEFPERPGALLHFLTEMGQRWNISLFHYRNHGAAYGKVLMGIQFPDQDKQEFESFLKQLNYPHWEEDQNPAYQLFLS